MRGMDEPVQEEIVSSRDNLLKEDPYRQSKQELLRNHSIEIRFLSRGCLVQLGCKSIPFETVENAMEAINAYVTDPITEIEKWNKIFK